MRKEVFKDDVGDDLKMRWGGVVRYIVAKVSGLLGPDSLRRPKRPNFLCQRLSSHFAERPRWKKCHSSPLWRETIDCSTSLTRYLCPQLPNKSALPFYPSLTSVWKCLKRGRGALYSDAKKMGHNIGAQQNCLKAFGIDNWAFSVIKVYQDPKGQKF